MPAPIARAAATVRPGRVEVHFPGVSICRRLVEATDRAMLTPSGCGQPRSRRRPCASRFRRVSVALRRLRLSERVCGTAGSARAGPARGRCAALDAFTPQNRLLVETFLDWDASGWR